MTQRRRSQRYGVDAASQAKLSPAPPGGSSASDYGSKIEESLSDGEFFSEGAATFAPPSSSTPISAAAAIKSNASRPSEATSQSSTKRKRATAEQSDIGVSGTRTVKEATVVEDVFSGPRLQPTTRVELQRTSNSAPNGLVKEALQSTAFSSQSSSSKPQEVNSRAIAGSLGRPSQPPSQQPAARFLQKSFSTGTNFSLLVTSDGHASIGAISQRKNEKENESVRLEGSSVPQIQVHLPATSSRQALSPKQRSQFNASTPLWQRMQSSNQSSSEGDSPPRDPRGDKGEEEDEEMTLRKVANRRAAKARAQQEAEILTRSNLNNPSSPSTPAPSSDARSVQSAASLKRPFRHSVPSLDVAAAHDRSLQPLSETMRAPQVKARSSASFGRTQSQPLHGKRGRPRKPLFTEYVEYDKHPNKTSQGKKKVVAAKPSTKAAGLEKPKALGLGGLARSQSYSTGSPLGRPSRSTYMALDGQLPPNSISGPASLAINPPRRSVSSNAAFSNNGSLDGFARPQSHSRYSLPSSRQSAARTESSQSSQMSDDWANSLISNTSSSQTSLSGSSSFFKNSSQERSSQFKDDSGFFGSDDESDELDMELDEIVQKKSKSKASPSKSSMGPQDQQENDRHAAELLLGLGSWSQ